MMHFGFEQGGWGGDGRVGFLTQGWLTISGHCPAPYILYNTLYYSVHCMQNILSHVFIVQLPRLPLRLPRPLTHLGMPSIDWPDVMMKQGPCIGCVGAH